MTTSGASGSGFHSVTQADDRWSVHVGQSYRVNNKAVYEVKDKQYMYL